MNDQLLEKLLEIINSVDFLIKENVPNIVSSSLEYYAWEAQASLILFLILAGLTLIPIIVYAYKAIVDDSDYIGGVIVCMVPFVLFFILSFACFTNLHKIEIAPKLYLIDKLRGE